MSGCEVTGCTEVASCDCLWGSDHLPTQVATLCQTHAQELWDRLNPLLRANLAWYRVDRPGQIARQVEQGRARSAS